MLRYVRGLSGRFVVAFCLGLLFTFLFTTVVVAPVLQPPIPQPPVEYKPPKFVQASDANIKYIGRWSMNPTKQAMSSYWAGAYFKTRFTGTTVRLKLAAPVNIYVQLDGGEDIFYGNANGMIDLAPEGLKAGEHALRVTARSETDSIQLQGLEIDAEAVTVMPNVSPMTIEFIGDSITAGYTSSKSALSSYAWLVGERLGVEHTQIAFTGICLVDNCANEHKPGMQTQFFKTQTTQTAQAYDWDFQRYQPQVVVVNLGTNDNSKVADYNFYTTYTMFLQQIRARYPKASIFVMSTFLNYLVEPTRMAAQNLIARGDNKVFFVNTNGWVHQGPDYVDGVHPSDTGHQKIAGLLGPLIGAQLPRTYHS